MNESLASERSGRDLTFEEMQQQEPERAKLLNHLQKFRINGIYIGGVGLAIIAGMWSFRTQFYSTSGLNDFTSQMPILFSGLVAIGGIIMLAGGIVFARGQVGISKSYREFDRSMAIIIAKEHNNEK